MIQTGGVFLGLSLQDGSLAAHLLQAYAEKGEGFARDLRGSFWIYLWDKARDLHLVYTNHVGDQRIFYYSDSAHFLVSNKQHHLVQKLKEAGQKVQLDTEAAYFLLTFAHLHGNRTLMAGIRQLQAGEYLKIEAGKLQVLRYYTLSNEPDNSLSFQDSLEEGDRLFREAVKKEFKKDQEYGYQSLSSLSGGLDSRMTTWVGHDYVQGQMSNLTFAQKGSYDLLIPQQIARDLDHRWIPVELEGHRFMDSMEELTPICEGIVSYLNISHSHWAMKQVDFSPFGLLHTGQLGDVVMGTFCQSDDYGKPAFTKAISHDLLHKLPQSDLEQYENLELMLFHNRGFNSALSGHLAIQEHSQVSSPFTDVDFMDFCLKIPLKYRLHHRLYKAWIKEKYPDAAGYVWEKLGRKITEPALRIRGKSVAVRGIPAFFAEGMIHHFKRISGRHVGRKTGMNPFQFWYNQDQAMAQRLDSYFREHAELVEDQELRSDCEALYRSGSIFEKAMVLSLLASIHYFRS